jgi:G:T/U-mismatch repair DNA glycosylase
VFRFGYACLFFAQLLAADIRAVFVNGGTAARLYQKHMKGCPVAQVLPSTSPANAAWSLERLCQAWQIVKEKAEE